MENPGIKFPPPLIYALFFAAGFVLEKFVPLSLPAIPFAHVVGWLLAVLSIIVVGLGFFEFFRARTSVLPDHPASALITRGIYRFTRNPLYLSMLLLYVGASIFFVVWWALVLLPILLWIMNVYVIKREERYLTEKFGDAYLEYCKRVRRWL